MHMLSTNNGHIIRGMKELKGRETHTSVLSLCPHSITACRMLKGLLGSRHERLTFFSNVRMGVPFTATVA